MDEESLMKKLFHNGVFYRVGEQAYGCFNCCRFCHNGHICSIFKKHVVDPKTILPECIEARKQAIEMDIKLQMEETMKSATTMVMIVCAMIMAGCSSVKPLDMNEALKHFYNQPNDITVQDVEFTDAGGTVTFTNVKHYKINTLIPQKNAIPRDPSFWESFGPSLGNLALAGTQLYQIAHPVQAQVVNPVQMPTQVINTSEE